MKKKNIFASKLITGVLLITGLSSFPVSALEQQLSKPVAQSNNQNAKLVVTEDNGHFYVVVNAEQNIKNLVINVTADNNKKFTFKKESLKKGEEAKFELELTPSTTSNSKKTLPNTSIVRDTLTLNNVIGGHSFNVYAAYDVETNTISTAKTNINTDSTRTSLEDIMKRNPNMSLYVENNNKKDKSFDSSKTLPKDEASKKDENKFNTIDKDKNSFADNNVVNNEEKTTKVDTNTKNENKIEENKITNSTSSTNVDTNLNTSNSNTTNKENTDISKPTSNNTNTELPTATAKPETGNAEPSDAPAEVINNSNNETSNSEIKIDTNKVDTAITAKETKVTAINAINNQTTATNATNLSIEAISSNVKEEQIKAEFINQLNKLRTVNNLPTLTENTMLNTSAKIRSNEVANLSSLDANIHGTNGSKEKAAATTAGYTGSILYNLAKISYNSTQTPEQIASQLLYTLYFEVNNVTTTYPYGHRNTLLHSGATETGVSITIKNGYVVLAQHLNYGNAGSFNGNTAIPSTYLDGKKY